MPSGKANSPPDRLTGDDGRLCGSFQWAPGSRSGADGGAHEYDTPIAPPGSQPQTVPDPLAVLRACLDSGDGEAWGELYLLTEKTVAGAVRRVLRNLGFAEVEAEEVVVEFIVALYYDDGRKLRSCVRDTQAEFRGRLRKAAIRFTLNWVRGHCRGLKRRRRAGARLIRQLGRETAFLTFGESERRGPDEREIEACLREWQSVISPPDFHRLLVLIGRSEPERPISDRTLRHWTQELFCKYRHLFLGDHR